MFSHTLILLATTMLGSLADSDFLKDRRNNYNSNVNENEIYGGYDNSGGSDIDGGKIRRVVSDDDPPYDFVLKPEILRDRYRGDLYDSPRYSLRGTGIGNEYDFPEADCDVVTMFRPGGIGDENPTGLLSEDGDRENSRRARLYRPYNPMRSENNVNSNVNNNIIGSKNRRTSNWGTRQKYGGALQYDKSNRGANSNPSAKSNVPTGRRSNTNFNVNTNVIRYGPYGAVANQDIRDKRPSYGEGDQEFGLPNKYQENFKTPLPSHYTASVPYYIRDQRPSYGEGDLEFGLPSKYQESVKTPLPTRYTTSAPYYIHNRDVTVDSIDKEDFADPSQSGSNVNVNSNMNIMSRRNNVNANTNKNAFSRIRRSINSAKESDRDGKITAGSSTMADFESSTSRVAEKREKSHGTRS